MVLFGVTLLPIVAPGASAMAVEEQASFHAREVPVSDVSDVTFLG